LHPPSSENRCPRALHHIKVRDIERKNIFKDDADRDKFLERLGGILANTKTPAWLERRLGLSQSAVSLAVSRRRKVAEERNYMIVECKTYNLKMSPTPQKILIADNVNAFQE